jgi:hypothetical protein
MSHLSLAEKNNLERNILTNFGVNEPQVSQNLSPNEMIERYEQMVGEYEKTLADNNRLINEQYNIIENYRQKELMDRAYISQLNFQYSYLIKQYSDLKKKCSHVGGKNKMKSKKRLSGRSKKTKKIYNKK